MDDVGEATRALLEEKPELEDGLRALLDVDADDEGWGFDDIPLGSGEFGEVVASGIVEKADGGYSVVDRKAVEAVLCGEDEREASPANDGVLENFRLRDFVDHTVDRTVFTAVSGTLALVVLFRSIPYPQVFRGNDVVLSSNDPYFYRYQVEQLTRQASGPIDVSLFAGLPEGVENGEPLLVATLAMGAELLGGGSQTVGLVLAWYPVISAVMTGFLVYLLAIELTRDRRVGLAAVAFLAIIPAHAFRTGVGFADHHAFDYPWLVLTSYALVRLSESDLRDRVTWVFAAILGGGIAAQTLAWDNSPLLLVPVGFYIATLVLVYARSNTSPIRGGLPILGGLGVATLVVQFAHLELGWHTQLVAFVPVLLFIGGSAVVLGAEVVERLGWSARALAGLEAVGAVAAFVLSFSLVPDAGATLNRGISVLVTQRNIAETSSLFSEQLGTFLGPLFLFGFVLLLATPYIIWFTYDVIRDNDVKKLVLVIYSSYFLFLSLLQVRFAGELSPFVAVIAGYGFVHVAAWVDLTREPNKQSREATRQSDPTEMLESPDRRTALRVAGLWMGIGSIGMLLTPMKHWQVVTGGKAHDAARWMRDHAEELGWSYPENYVFSRWDENRMFNWFVSGESRTYTYARDNFQQFLQSDDGEKWYRELRNRVGFIVIDGSGPVISRETPTIYDGLESFGGDGNRHPRGSGHYRLRYTSNDNDLKVFTLVPGATITGPSPPGDTYDITTSVDVSTGALQYTRTVSANDHGIFQFRVPYAGEYVLGDRTVTISESDVEEGSRYHFFDGKASSDWPFDENTGEWAYDRAGGNHGRIVNAKWSTGEQRSALSFDPDEGSRVVADPETGETESFTLSSWIKPDTPNSRAIISTGKDGGKDSKYGFLFDHGQSGWSDDRLGLYVGDGNEQSYATSPPLNLEYPSESFHNVGVVFDEGTIRWYLDGEPLGEGAVDVGRIVFVDARETYIGKEYSGYGGDGFFSGEIASVQYHRTAVSDYSSVV